MHGRVRIGARTASRLGFSAAGLGRPGMWGEPASREAALEAIRLAARLGADLIEVLVPFGPSADLLRAARPDGVAAVVRLTSAVTDSRAVTTRLGDVPVAAVLAQPGHPAWRWDLPMGLLATTPDDLDAAAEAVGLAGAWPPPVGLLEWCEATRRPYFTNSVSALAGSDLTVVLPVAHSSQEVAALVNPPGAKRK